VAGIEVLESGPTPRRDRLSLAVDSFEPGPGAAASPPTVPVPASGGGPRTGGFEGRRGREILMDTVANNTTTSSFASSSSGLSLARSGAGWSLSFEDRRLTNHPDITEPKPPFMDGISGAVQIRPPSDSSPAPALLATLGDGSRILSVTLREWRLQPWSPR
jgi:hypothetical protein